MMGTLLTLLLVTFKMALILIGAVASRTLVSLAAMLPVTFKSVFTLKLTVACGTLVGSLAAMLLVTFKSRSTLKLAVARGTLIGFTRQTTTFLVTLKSMLILKGSMVASGTLVGLTRYVATSPVILETPQILERWMVASGAVICTICLSIHIIETARH